MYFASGAEIRALYPATRGIRVGYVASGRRTTRIPFHLPETALERHGVIFGKQGSGKTVFLKNLLSDNLYGQDGDGLQVPALVFGHPDLVLENRSAGTLGLLALEDDRIVTFGYDRAIKLHPQEIALEDVFHQFPEMSPAMRDLWFHVARRSPGDFIGRLARYDVNADPLELVLRTEQVGAPKKPVQRGVAPRSTVNACIRQARILGSQLSASAQPVLSRIALALQERKTVLVNTYNLSDYGAAFFIRLVLTRLTRLGERALHKGRAQRYFVIVDEAQHFLQRAAEEVTEFVRTCRKFGVTLFFATQSPSCIPTSVYGQLYTTVSFHLSKADVRALLEVCPALEDTKHVLLRPPLKNTLGTAAVSALGYPYPCTIRTEPFERVVERIRRLRESLKHEGGTHDGRRTALPAPARG
ncbi:MAG: ATP-binding protein [Nitrospinota bacterium]